MVGLHIKIWNQIKKDLVEFYQMMQKQDTSQYRA